jgi:zinc transport system permease protein
MMGSLLISAVIIFPTLSAMRLCKSFKGVTIGAAVIAGIGFVVGLVISFVWGTPVGASIVVVHFAIFVIAAILGRIYPEKH